MSARERALRLVATGLGRRGLEVRRHAAARRQKMLSKHDVDLVFDVGAADGGYGTTLRSFGYTRSIVSFEPLRGVFTRLTSTIEADPGWTARHLALGAEPGEATINVASNSTSSSILPMLGPHLQAAPHVTYVGQETITVSTLDVEAADLLDSHERPFLKVDTQGFEREVIAGGTSTLERCVGVQLELSFVPLYEGGMLVDEAVSWAYDHGFHLVGIEQGYAAPSGEILQVDGVFVRS